MTKITNPVDWCIDRHRQTNHMYDTYLPYEFHLRMVVQVANQFQKLALGYWNDMEILVNAAWGHDLIEDTRTSYNDVKDMLGTEAADIIYAVSNEKGKNRKERANDKYYQGIRETRGAIFVKLCDRIANVQYSKMTKSRMFEQYKKENPEFMRQLGWREGCVDHLNPMFEELINLFKD